MAESSNHDPVPELALALAVVRQAMHDLRVRTVTKNCQPSDHDRVTARRFLLVDLWEEGHTWGELLRLYGANRLTRARLCHAVRTVTDD